MVTQWQRLTQNGILTIFFPVVIMTKPWKFGLANSAWKRAIGGNFKEPGEGESPQQERKPSHIVHVLFSLTGAGSEPVLSGMGLKGLELGENCPQKPKSAKLGRASISH